MPDPRPDEQGHRPWLRNGARSPWRSARSKPLARAPRTRADRAVDPRRSGDRGGAVGSRYRRGFENVLARRLDDLTAPTSSRQHHEPLETTTWIVVRLRSMVCQHGRDRSVADEALPREELERALGELLNVLGMARYLARVDVSPGRGRAQHRRQPGAARRPAPHGVRDGLAEGRRPAASATTPATPGCDFAVVVTARLASQDKRGAPRFRAALLAAILSAACSRGIAVRGRDG